MSEEKLFEMKYYKPDANFKCDLQTLYFVKMAFFIHSGNSSTCNGFRSLLGMIEKAENEYENSDIVVLSNVIKTNGKSMTITDTSSIKKLKTND